MRPTRRGYAALVVVATAIVFAWGAGPRALNAVAGPVLVAVVTAAVQVHRAGKPRVERSEPRRGFPGETRTVELTVDGGGVATITDGVDDGRAETETFERTLPTTVHYEVTYEHRGVYSLGATRVRVRDVLGLVEETYVIDETTEVLVYPPVYSVENAGSFLRTLGPRSDERSEFDRLREYVPGDALRDIHWKSSAKHDDLLVTEFSDPRDEEAVTIAAACEPDYADEMATAAATMLVAAVRLGLSVDLTVPEGRLPQGYGESHEQHALQLLARTEGGGVPEGRWESANVRIHAGESGVSVSVDDQVHSLEDLTTNRNNPLLTEVPV